METYTLNSLEYAATGDGPWRIYVYDTLGYHRGGKWFHKGPMQYPDEEITAQAAHNATTQAMHDGREVRICDGGDKLVFHAVAGGVAYGDNFWNEIGITKPSERIN